MTMTQTSINIQPVKAGSRQHNNREKDLPYVRSELTYLNESWIADEKMTIERHLDDIKKDFHSHHGKRLHAKATPIREGVVVIKPDTTIEQLRNACAICEQAFGIKPLEIYLHKDEGHHRAKVWKSNLHAHIVFSWYDFKTHTTVKLNRDDTSRLQDIFAEALKMERGVSSDVKHLSAVQYKNHVEDQRVIELQAEINDLEGEILDQTEQMIVMLHQNQFVANTAVNHFDALAEDIVPTAADLQSRNHLHNLANENVEKVITDNRFYGYVKQLLKTLQAVTHSIVKMYNAMCVLRPALRHENDRLKAENNELRKKVTGLSYTVMTMKEKSNVAQKKKGI